MCWFQSFSLSCYLEPQIIFPCLDIGSATATLDPRPRHWTGDPRPATRDPRLLVKLACTASSHTISVKAFRWHTWGKQNRSDHVTRNALAVRNNEAYNTDKSRQTVVLYSPFCIIKNTGHGNFVVGSFHTRARKWIIGQTLACVQSPPPPQTPLFLFFFWREGAAVHRLSRTDNPSSNCPSKLADKVRQIVHSKLKQFHFQIKTYYLSGANYQTDNPSHTNDLFLVWKRPFLL